MTEAEWRDAADRLRERLRPNGGEQAVVAFQGERGAYGHLAIERLWGARAWLLPCWTFADVIARLEQGRAEFAVLPLRNEIVGEIPGIAESIEDAELEIVGELRLPVRHCLLALPGSGLDDITTVFSHPVALSQCKKFLEAHPAMRPREANDTAGSARDVAARGRANEGAIAAEGCAERYGLHVVARNVGDREDNATVFGVVRRA